MMFKRRNFVKLGNHLGTSPYVSVFHSGTPAYNDLFGNIIYKQQKQQQQKNHQIFHLKYKPW